MQVQQSGAPSFQLTRQLMLRGLAAVYLAAFLSVAVQGQGLMGRNGLLPMAEGLEQAEASDPVGCLYTHPTLFWIYRADFAIDVAWTIGALGSIVVMTGYGQLLGLITCWLAYLTLAVGGRAFFTAPADDLLLEAGFMALLLAPWRLTPTATLDACVSRLILSLFAWLALRATLLPVVSGLLSGGSAWRDGSVLQQWLLGQPLPTWLGWFAAQLPATHLATFALAGMATLLVLPLLFLTGRRGRILLAMLLILFQVANLFLGNRGVYPFVAAVTCFGMIDDAGWTSLRHFLSHPLRKIRSRQPAVGIAARRDADSYAPNSVRAGRPSWFIVPLAGVLFGLSVLVIARDLGSPIMASYLSRFEATARSWRLVGSYVGHGSVNARKVEIVIEGSADGVVWRPCLFAHKPDDLAGAPAILGPHLPRLDWRMSRLTADPAEQVWFDTLLRRLLEGRAEVAHLLANDPFAGQRPPFIRARAFHFEAATPAQHAEGYWWQRRYLMDVREPRRLSPHGDAVIEVTPHP